MSSLLLRFGLWIVLISLALYVLLETFPNSPASEFVSGPLIPRMGLAGVLMVVSGFLLTFFEKAAKKVTRQRCVVCRKPITHGEIYCREHLRRVLEEEHDRRHAIHRT